MLETVVRYGIAVIFTIISMILVAHILDKLWGVFSGLQRFAKRGVTSADDLLKLTLSYDLLMVIVIFFTLIGGTLARIYILSDEVDSGIIYLISILTIVYSVTLLTLLIFLYKICDTYRGQRDQKKPI